MIDQMTTREKTLALIVGGLVAVIVTVMVSKVILRHKAALDGQILAKKTELSAMETLIAERATWEQRDQWLQANLKPAESASRVGNDLLEELKGVADRLSIKVDQPVIGSLTSPSPHYQEVTVTFDTTSKWENLVDFLYEAQAPTKFVVVKNCNVEVDKTDKTQVHGRFTVARLFARK